MKIRTQFTLLLSLFGLLLFVMAISLAFTAQQVTRLVKQEEISRHIEQSVSNLSYMAGDYVMYGEDQQRERWETEFSALAANISRLEASSPEQRAIISHLKDDQARMQAVFMDVAATIEKSPQPSLVTLDPAFMQVAWSRIEVQNRGIASEAALLSQKLRDQSDQLKQMDLILIFALSGIFGISLLSNSLLIRRRILRAITELHAGTMIIGSGNLDFTIPIRQADEIGELSQAFNQMAANLKQVTASKSELESEIEERKRAEEALRGSEARLRAVLDNTPDAIFLKDCESRLLLANPATFAVIGKPAEDVLGKMDSEIYDDPATGRTIMENDQRILASGKIETVEESVSTPSGIVTYLSTKAPYRDAEGHIIGIIGTARDITVRKQADEQIRCQEKELRLVMDTVPALLSRIDREFRYLRVNRGYGDWFGLKQQDIEGRFVWEVVGEAAWNLGRVRLERAMSGEVVSYEEKMPYQHGGYRWVAATLVPDRDETGSVQGIVALVIDITDRKRVEDALQASNEELQVVTEELRSQNDELRQARSALEESEERLNFVMNACHIGAWELDIDTQIITRSPEYARLYGYSVDQDQWTYNTWLNHILPEDRDKVEASIQKSIQTQGGWDCEFRILRPDGKMRWIWALGAQRQDSQGIVCSMAGIVQDITERKQAEGQLRYQATMLSSVNDAIVASDAQFRITAWNAAAENLYGWKTEEVIGRDGLEIIHTEWPEKDSDEMRRAIAQMGRWRGEAIQARKDGTRFPVDVSSITLRNDEGQITGYVSVNRDITARRQADEAIRQSKATILSFYDSAPFLMGIAELDGDKTVIVSGNRALADFFGRRPDELPGLTGTELSKFPATQPIWVENYRRSQQEGVPVHFEYEYPRAGNVYWLSATVAFIEISPTGRPRFSFVIEDITERKRMEQMLLLTQADLEHAQEVGQIGSWRLDIRRNVFTWSNENYRIFGVPAGTPMAYESFLEKIHPDDREYVKEQWNAGLRGEPYDIEHRILVDGQVKWVRERAYLEIDSSGGLLGGFGITQDVTKRKQAEQMLMAAHAETVTERNRLRAVMEALPVGVAIVDAQGGNIQANRAFEDVWGGPRPEASGINDYAAYKAWWPDTGRLVQAEEWASAQVIQTGEPVIGQVLKLQRFDGTYAYVVNSGAPICGDDGQIQGCAVAILDITAEKKAEDALKESEKRYRELVQYAPAGIYEIDFRTRKFMSINDAMCQMSGYTREELLDMEPLAVLDQDSQKLFMQRLQMWLEGNPPQENVEYVIARKDGSKIYVLLNVTFTRDVLGTPLGASVISYDITDRKKAEQNLQMINRTLKALSNSNQAMMRAGSEADLLNNVCKIIVEDCGYAMVWVGYAENDKEKSVRPVASAGFEAGYLETLKITWADTERGRGPTGTAIRSGKTSRCRDVLTDPQFAPWREQALKRGYASSMVVPILQNDKPFGAITIYANEPDVFSDDEEKLLVQLAGDLAYGIQMIRLRESLRQSEEKYRNLFESMTEEVHFWRLVRDDLGCIQTWRLVDANPPTLKTWGRATLEEIQGKTTDEIFGPGSTEHYMPVVQKIMTEGIPYSYEDYFPQLDKYFRFTSVPLGEYFITTGADITGLKKAEQALRTAYVELEQRVTELQTLMDVAPVAIGIGLDPQGKRVAANRVLAEWLGAPEGANVSLSMPKERRPIDYQVLRNGQPVSTTELPVQYAALNARSVRNDELTLAFSNGKTMELLANAEPLFDADGGVRGSIATYIDISERKRAEDELRAAHDELEERVRERTAELEQRNIELQVLSAAEHEQHQLAEALVKAALVLNKSLDQDEVLKHILEQIQKVIPYQFASIALLDGETFYDASHQGVLGPSADQYDIRQRFRLKDFPALKGMRRTGRPVLMPDTSQDANWAAIGSLTWSRSFLSAPLLVEKRVIGFVNLFSAQPLFFTPAMRDRLVAFAAHAAVAIQNAWLFERVRAGGERLQSLSRRLVEIQEDERHYIARELHDEAGQMLASLIVHLRVLEKHASQPDLVLKKITEMEASLNEVFDSLHRIAVALRPATLDHLGLVAALHQYVEALGEKQRLEIRFSSERVQERLPVNVETVLYRIAQESLTNVVRHAHATQVDVVLTLRDDKAILIIEDNGVGFEPKAILDSNHLGLFGMRERIETVDGKLVIESAPGKGTTVMAEVKIYPAP